MSNVDAFWSKSGVQKRIRQILAWIVLISLLGMPVSAGAQPEQDYNPDVPFRDLAGHWAAEAIQSAYREGLFVGEDGFLFRPEQQMSRAEFIVLVDRLFLSKEYQFFTLTLLMEHDEFGWGDGFAEPYLPYQDVDRLTWMYPSVLRVFLVMDRLYGPGALQEVFPGNKLHPAQPITKREAEALLRMFAIQADEGPYKALWPSLPPGDQAVIRRADAAVAASRLNTYLETAPILPLLDEDGQKFPLVPEISELFPVFESFFGEDTRQARQTYLQAVERVRTGVETALAFRQLRQLAGSRFSNQVGVRYYLSWDDSTSLVDNMRQAYLALEEYFQAGPTSPEVLQLLVANVYDLALQLEREQPTVMLEARQRLLDHLSQLEPGTTEWLSLSLYLAAMEVRSGDKEQALARYRQLVESKEGLTNAVYYLLSSGRLVEAEQLLAQAQASAQLEQVYLDRLRQELNLIARQAEVAKQLTEALQKRRASPGIVIQGESMRNDYLYRYHIKQDQRNGLSHTQGIFQAPDKLVLQKLEAYADMNNHRLYLYDYDTDSWQQSRLGTIQYVHEWLDTLSVAERLRLLGARYLLQEGENYAVITEWIPQASLTERSAVLAVSAGKLLAVPVCVNKYYLDRTSGQLVRRVWHYEEFYESGQYIAFLGEETYMHDPALRIQLPTGVVKGGR